MKPPARAYSSDRTSANAESAIAGNRSLLFESPETADERKAVLSRHGEVRDHHVRRMVERWFGQSELVEHFLDVLRKAGVEVGAKGPSGRKSGRRGARRARRKECAYRAYLSHERRSPSGCIAGQSGAHIP